LFTVSAIAAIAAIVGGALGVRHLLTTAPASCQQMAAAAAALDGAADPRINVIIGVAGNNAEVASEAQSFIESAVQAPSAVSAVVVTVVLVDGNKMYMPSTATRGCLDRSLLVAPAAADLASYRKANSSTRSAVADALEGEFKRGVEQIAAAAARAVLAAPKPADIDAGAYAIWPFVTAVPRSTNVAVLDTFTTAGKNCLTLSAPDEVTALGVSAVAERVSACVRTHFLQSATTSHLELQPVTALDLTGGQRGAQATVIAALCKYATETSTCSQGE
jgi:hypothetical protein